MPQMYKVHTKETVHSIYVIEADSPEEAEQIFNEGLSGNADFIETLDEEVTCVEEKEE